MKHIKLFENFNKEEINEARYDDLKKSEFGYSKRIEDAFNEFKNQSAVIYSKHGDKEYPAKTNIKIITNTHQLPNVEEQDKEQGEYSFTPVLDITTDKYDVNVHITLYKGIKPNHVVSMGYITGGVDDETMMLITKFIYKAAEYAKISEPEADVLVDAAYKELTKK